MGKQKSVYTWIVLVLLALGLFFGTISVIFNLIIIQALLTVGTSLNPVANIINLILLIIGLVIAGIFFVKLYNVKPEVFKWVNIAFGYYVFSNLSNIVLTTMSVGLIGGILSSVLLIIILPIIILIWVTFYLHLKKAQRENRMDFS